MSEASRAYIEGLNFVRVSISALLSLTVAAAMPSLGRAAIEPTAPVAAESEFHFVVLGDSQFDDPSVFNRTVDQVRMLRPAFVIQVGDLIDGYLDDFEAVGNEWRRFRHQIAPLGEIPFYAVPGNHDLYNGRREVDPRLERLFEEQWGALYYRFRYGNSAFVILNSDSSRLQNGIDAEQVRWLSGVLAGEDAAHIFVFLHRPPRFLNGGAALHDLFVRHGVDYVIYGHHHHYHHELRDGVHYVMTNNSGENALRHAELGSFNHLLQISVRDDEVSLASIEVDAIRPLDFVAPVDNYEFFALTQRLTADHVEATLVDEHRYGFELVLNNPTERAIDAYLSCASTDGRWSFTPRAIAAVPIGPKSSATLELEAEHSATRIPESEPACRIEIPYQTVSGKWFDLELDVAVAIP